jgi:hypothetical protein
MLYGSTLRQSVIFCDGNLISLVGNLSIHMLVSFFVFNSKAYDFMFFEFVVHALLLSKLCIICLINLFKFNACYMPHSMWNGHLWKYIHYQEKE